MSWFLYLLTIWNKDTMRHSRNFQIWCLILSMLFIWTEAVRVLNYVNICIYIFWDISKKKGEKRHDTILRLVRFNVNISRAMMTWPQYGAGAQRCLRPCLSSANVHIEPEPSVSFKRSKATLGKGFLTFPPEKRKQEDFVCAYTAYRSVFRLC